MSNLNYNKVIIGGRLTSKPELKTTQSGLSVTTFTVAVNRKTKSGEQPQADFFNVTAWRQTAETVTKYFDKGSSILVTGSLQTRSYTDKENQKRNVTEIVADEVHFVDSRAESQGQGAQQSWNAPQTAQDAAQSYYTQQAYTNAPTQQMSLQGNTMPTQAAQDANDAFGTEEELPF